jgi:hypothetical protein
MSAGDKFSDDEPRPNPFSPEQTAHAQAPGPEIPYFSGKQYERSQEYLDIIARTLVMQSIPEYQWEIVSISMHNAHLLCKFQY